ncbi:MAG: hypothetical protein IKE73_00370 [Bacilli bacterium]|nr:hypothetical protein [Bacilli bacterium]
MENRREYERKLFEKRYSEIKNYERLSILEAKKLYNEAMENPNLEIRKRLLNKVIEGTLYIVYKRIEKIMFELFESPVYDIDDFINSYTEYWIKGIYEGILNNKNVSNYLHYFFYSNMLDSLNGLSSENNLEIKSTSRILDKLLPAYIELEKTLKRQPSFKELADYCELSVSMVERYYNYIDKFYNEYYESLINDGDCFEYLLSNNSKKFNMQVFLDSFNNAELSDNYYQPKSMEEAIINKKYLIDLKEKLLEIINDRHNKYNYQKRNAEIFLKFFGFYDENRYSFDDLSKEYHIGRERIRQIIIKYIKYIKPRLKQFDLYRPELLSSTYIKNNIKNKNSYVISMDFKKKQKNIDNNKMKEITKKRNLTNCEHLSRKIDDNHSLQIVKPLVKEVEKKVEVSEDVLRVRRLIEKLKYDDPTTAEYESLAREAIEINPLYIRFVSNKAKCYEELVNICKEKKPNIIIKSYNKTDISINSDSKLVNDNVVKPIIKFSAKELIEKLKNDDPTTAEYELLARKAIEKSRLYIKFVSNKVRCYEELVNICEKAKTLSYKYNNR